MPRRFHRLLSRLGAFTLLTSLSACGGLPSGGARQPSYALKDQDHTPLAQALRPRTTGHPGQSGFHALGDGRDALAARLVLADSAQSSLDVQYYIWHADMAGKVLLDRLLRAADRGVRVRLLLDDIGTMTADSTLLAIDDHPNIEVRMFNPVAIRSPRWFGILADFKRINRRMHNKSLTADGQVSIVGGRNIGDEYFGAHEGMNFADLDLAVIGPAVREVSDEFDLYWNHRASVPVTALSKNHPTPEALAQMRKNLLEYDAAAVQSEYAASIRSSEFARQLKERSVSYSWGRATIVHDHPDKATTPAGDTETHLAPQLRALVDSSKQEVCLVSPYFVPGKRGVDLLTEMRRRGLRVIILTNSLASTDGVAVHSKYRLYRKPLLDAGVELYEMKPAPADTHARRSESLLGPHGSSGAGLHAKTFAFDRHTGFVGSYNLDPRSSRLNTEMGVVFECPELTARLPEMLERTLPIGAYRIERVGRHIEWVTLQDGAEVRYRTEPETSFGKRLKARILGWLPIEGLL